MEEIDTLTLVGQELTPAYVFKEVLVNFKAITISFTSRNSLASFRVAIHGVKKRYEQQLLKDNKALGLVYTGLEDYSVLSEKVSDLPNLQYRFYLGKHKRQSYTVVSVEKRITHGETQS